MAATCNWCNQEMIPRQGCTTTIYDDFADGIARQRIPYGSEKMYEPSDYWPPEPERTCHDCGVTVGQFHHPGCDMEECPRCGWQALACGCTRADEDDE